MTQPRAVADAPAARDRRALYRLVGQHAPSPPVDTVIDSYAAALWPRADATAPAAVQLEYVPRRDQALLEADPAWSASGTATATLEGGLLVDRGLAGARRQYRRELSPGAALAVDLLVRRVGGSDADCRVTLENGGRAETLVIGRGSIWLDSAPAPVPLDTDRFHAYRLVVSQVATWLFVDGYLSMGSQAKAAAPGARLAIGGQPPNGSSDAETHWAWVRVLSGAGEAALWPEPELPDAHRREGERLLDEDRPIEALSMLRRGLWLAPADPELTAALGRTIERAAALPKVPLGELEALGALVPDGAAPWRAILAARRANVVMRAHCLGVKFPSGTSTLKELLGSLFAGKRLTRDSDFWALRDVSFDVERGDIIGVIGKNGSGKSTLLRAMVPMLEHDTGTIEVRGQPILLAAGMGFREELSGRDNVYLGGVFLGLTRREIAAHFDAIVDFAELADHIDRPFCHYSDGMKARLIFSVATTVSPDILLLDEMLGAGDVSFHEKAATRMRQLLDRARSILVVTHDLRFVRRHCSRALYLVGGRVRYHGDPDRAVDLFLQETGVSGA